jgi:hypothetical protein
VGEFQWNNVGTIEKFCYSQFYECDFKILCGENYNILQGVSEKERKSGQFLGLLTCSLATVEAYC